MKKCPVCNQTYTDETLNFCLNDGGALTNINDDAPPTVFMNRARTTNQNWNAPEPFSPPVYQPPPFRQNQQLFANQPFISPVGMAFQNKTLPTVSLVLGILGLVLFCCYGGVPLGIGALVTGYLGLNNTSQNPQMFGGRGMAVAGMILGGLALAGNMLLFLYANFGK